MFLGGDTLIECELCLLKAAYKKGYMYYHLLSGVDYPIKSQDFIHDFFKKNQGKNYMSFASDEISYEFAKYRMEYRHYFQNIIGRSPEICKNILYRIDKKMTSLQKVMGMSRLKNSGLIMKKGANWFSITHELANVLIDSEDVIKKYFYHGICVDEMFAITMAYNSKLRKTLVNNNLRYILWDGKAHPRILNCSNYQDMMQSDCLFARKFSEKYDMEVVYKIREQNKL